MSFKSTERTSQLLGSYLSQIQNPAAVAEEADAAAVAVVEAVVEVVVEVTGVVAKTRNQKKTPLRKNLLAMDRRVRRGNVTLNQTVVRTRM